MEVSDSRTVSRRLTVYITPRNVILFIFVVFCIYFSSILFIVMSPGWSTMQVAYNDPTKERLMSSFDKKIESTALLSLKEGQPHDLPSKNDDDEADKQSILLKKLKTIFASKPLPSIPENSYRKVTSPKKSTSYKDESWESSTRAASEPSRVYSREFIQAPPLPFTSILEISPRSAVHPIHHVDSISLDDTEAMRDAIAQEMRHAYGGYELYAWGFDDLKPLTRIGINHYNLGLSIVDSLDTLYILGLDEQFERGVQWVTDHLVIGPQKEISVFESTIRAIGGLLSAYQLSKRDILLKKAEELAEAFIPAFNTATGLPLSALTVYLGESENRSVYSSTSEVMTLQLEFQLLSRLTGNPIYANLVNRITKTFDSLKTPLYTRFISPNSLYIPDDTITLGSRVDSIYEYLLKQYLLAGGGLAYQHKKPLELSPEIALPLKMYRESSRAIIDNLVYASSPNRMTFIAERVNSIYVGKMDHLVCFLPAVYALGAQYGAVEGDEATVHLDLASELTHTCSGFWSNSPSGIAAEIVTFVLEVEEKGISEVDPHVDIVSPYPSMIIPESRVGEPRVKVNAAKVDFDYGVNKGAKHSYLRPETLESMFIMYRLTKDPKYRIDAWNIFKSLVRYSRLNNGGYAALVDIHRTDIDPKYYTSGVKASYTWANWKDRLDSFVFAETFKYLYLIFCDDDVIPLDQWVFNTEAHPFQVDPAVMEDLGIPIKNPIPNKRV